MFKRLHLNFCPQDLDLQIVHCDQNFISGKDQITFPAIVYHLKIEHLRKVNANEASNVIPWPTRIDYFEVAEELNELSEKSFILASVVQIVVKRLADQTGFKRDLLKFLKECKHLKRLILERCIGQAILWQSVCEYTS